MKKIAIGNNVYININNCIIETDQINIQNTISKSFDFEIVRNNTVIKTINFPIENQTLSKGDYLDINGIHKIETDEIINYTSEQLIAFEDMSNINIAKAGFYVKLSNQNASLKLYYYKNDEIDEQIYVLNKDEELITVFNVNDKDTIINPKIKETQNAEAVFTFTIPITNPKWKEINNPENLYFVKDKIFSTNFEGSFQETLTEQDEDYVLVTAYERQKLLARRYVRAWNSETGFAGIDSFMVVVLSNGNLPLKNDDNYVNSTHLAGTSGFALDALLYGTGWKTGICDVEGSYDFETDQVNIYDNILKVQEIWGGILIFDSVNKIVHHRDETKYLPYNGFEVKYAKNMQSLEKQYNNKIITQLCPLGEGGLNIKSVNNNSIWLTNTSYTNTIMQEIVNNDDISEPEQLMKWGKRKLEELCKPRKELTVQMVLLYQVEGYELETVALNDIVDVINYAGIDNDIEQLRIVNFEYGIWDYSDAVVELSDITLESTDIFKKTIQATNSINSGTLNSKKVVNFFKNGQSINETFKELNDTIIDTRSDLIKTDEEITAKITKTETEYNKLNDLVISQNKLISEMQLTIEGLRNSLKDIGGSNLLRNSVGFFGSNNTLEYWEGSAIGYTDTDIKNNNVSKNAIRLKNSSLLQNLTNLKDGTYNISFNYKKQISASNVSFMLNNDTTTKEILNNEEWTTIEKEIIIKNHFFSIKFDSDTDDSCDISDLILTYGKEKQIWSQNANETQTDTVSIGKGIQVDSSTTNIFTRIDSDGNRSYNRNTGEIVMEATDKGIYGLSLEIKNNGNLCGLLHQKINNQVVVNVIV